MRRKTLLATALCVLVSIGVISVGVGPWRMLLMKRISICLVEEGRPSAVVIHGWQREPRSWLPESLKAKLPVELDTSTQWHWRGHEGRELFVHTREGSVSLGDDGSILVVSGSGFPGDRSDIEGVRAVVARSRYEIESAAARGEIVLPNWWPENDESFFP